MGADRQGRAAIASVAFCVNAEKPRAFARRDELAALAHRLGLRILAEGEAEVTVVLGGDGTILRAVRAHPRVPVLGLNLGSLGYLASVEERDFARAVTMLAEGRYRLSRRSALAVRRVGGPGGRRAAAAVALNDIVVMREQSGHAAVLDLAVDGRSASRYMADGVVVATPTGSTAYSLSAGGPVLMPDADAFVVTPMNPHALGVRPMVVPDAARLTVTSRRKVNGRAERIGVYADGESVLTLDGDETIEIRKAARSVPLVELEGHDPYEVMARKLGWSGAGGGRR